MKNKNKVVSDSRLFETFVLYFLADGPVAQKGMNSGNIITTIHALASRAIKSAF